MGTEIIVMSEHEINHVKASGSNQATAASTSEFDPNSYRFSSAAISFAALMEMLEMQMKAYQDMAKMSVLSTQCRASSIQATADSTIAAGCEEQSSFFAQMGESIGMSATSLLTGACSALYNKSDLTKSDTDLKNINDLATIKPDDNNQAVLQNVQNAQDNNAPNAQDNNDTLRNDITTYGEKIYDIKLSDHANNANNVNADNECVRKMKRLLGLKGEDVKFAEFVRDHIKHYQKLASNKSLQLGNETQKFTNTISSISGFINNLTGSGMKGAQGAYAANKAKDNANQQMSQSNQSFSQEVQKAQQDASQQYAQQATQTFRTVSEIVGVDTRRG